MEHRSRQRVQTKGAAGTFTLEDPAMTGQLTAMGELNWIPDGESDSVKRHWMGN